MSDVWALRILVVAVIATSTFLLMEWLVGGWEW
jgi:hypothetical protein